MTTSYYGMFVLPENDALQINRIEIPLIQRDYAQGRKGERVRRIRDAFLEVLCPAVAPGGAPADLDFIYGEVNNGTLIPLDGQQRLTTLFLLHWYLAVRVGHPVQGQPWMQFSYATRPSARRFCERLSQYQPPILLPLYSEWIKDQVWYFATWCHDPTVSSMLVMLDAIHERLGGIDCQAAWARLTDPETPAITFQLLPVKWTGHSDDLYIKMNSRGKPLTEFEHFKARFEQWHCPNAGILADKLDDAWSHLFWQFHGDDGIVDDEFLRYIRFVTEVCVWRGGEALPERDLTALAASVYGPHVERQRRASNLDFLIDAFDTWGGLDIPNLFSHIFTVDLANGGHDQVLLFGPQGAEGTNLFAGCCRRYGNMRGDNGTFSLAQTLLFYGVLLHRLHETPDLPRRLRVLRNLIEASSNEIRLDRT